MVQLCIRTLLCLALLAGNTLNASVFTRPAGVEAGERVYLNPTTGRFWTSDTFAGRNEDPISLHKYLYCQANAVNHIDPSGHDLGDLLTAMYVGASLGAMNFLVTAGSYGIAETTLSIIALGYADSLSSGNYGTAAAMLGVDAFTFGEGGRILRFPGWANLNQIKGWTTVLYAEHAADAPASRKAMAAALQFSEQIAEGSLKVGGKGAQGADIVAQAVVNGTSQTLKREVSVFQGDLTKNGGKALYDKILGEAAQTSGAQIKQVFIQITDNVTSVQNWKQIVAEKVQNARTFLGDVTIYVVDSDGRPVVQ